MLESDYVFAPFRQFLEALLRRMLGKKQEEDVAMPSTDDAEGVFGLPIAILDTMDAASVARVLSMPQWLECYAIIAAGRGRIARAAELLERAVAAGHPEPTRLREAIAVLREAKKI